jgi:hypothetical protein
MAMLRCYFQGDPSQNFLVIMKDDAIFKNLLQVRL